MPLVQEGFGGSLTEAATRFYDLADAMGTILAGIEGRPLPSQVPSQLFD